MLEAIADERDDYAVTDARLTLKPLIAALNEREKRIVAAIAVSRQTVKAIAPQFGITPQRVGKIYRTALEKMKAGLLNGGAVKKRGRPKKKRG